MQAAFSSWKHRFYKDACLWLYHFASFLQYLHWILSQPWWLGRVGGIQCFYLLFKCITASCHKRHPWKCKYTLGIQDKCGFMCFLHLRSILGPCCCLAARQASLSITSSQSLLKLMSIELVMPSNHLILYHLLLPPSFPTSGSFQMSQFFASGAQSIGVSALASVLPMNIQDWFPLGWTG